MTHGRVSIIIPCYNSARHLPRAIRSVLWQTHADWECIIVDDGSTDETPALVAREVSADRRFRYIAKGHSGTAATRNAGIEAATGEFLQFLDADDILLARKLEVCVGKLRADPSSGVAYSEFAYYKPPSEYFQLLPSAIPSNEPLRGFLVDWDVSFMVPIHSFLFRASAFGRQRFDVTLASHFEDVECWIRLAAEGIAFVQIPEILAVYCLSEGSTSSRGTVLLSSQLNVVETYRSHPSCARFQPEFNSAVRRIRQRLASAYFREKDFRKGREIMAREWPSASTSARLKMLGWLALMSVVSSDTVARLRGWLARSTPFRWGAWTHRRSWEPPASVRQLLELKG